MSKSQLRLDDVITFGKHNGSEVEDLLEDDPGWMAWMYEQNPNVFDVEVVEAMEKRKII